MRRLGALLLALAAGASHAAGKPSETLDRFHQALRDNQPGEALALLADDAVIYEQGFSEISRDEWARQQLAAAIAFARDTERRVLRRAAASSGDTAWFTSTTQTVLDVTTRQVVMDGAETAILRRGQDGRWKIVHLHWSAHQADADSAGGLTPEPAPGAPSEVHP